MDIYSSQGSTRASVNDAASLSSQATDNFWQPLLTDLIHDISQISAGLPDTGFSLVQGSLTGDNLTLVGEGSPGCSLSAHIGALSEHTAGGRAALHADDLLPGLLRCLTGHTDNRHAGMVPPARPRLDSGGSVSSVISDSALGTWAQDTQGLSRG